VSTTRRVGRPSINALQEGASAMFSHIVVGTSDMERARKFYDAVLGTLGYGKGFRRATGDVVYPWNDGFFVVTRQSGGQASTDVDDDTVTFLCTSAEQADRWHAAGIANGGQSVEHPLRADEPRVGAPYRAYLCDPDGNRLCALHHTTNGMAPAKGSI
jgi:catechol 2,3-dioxygenase-like lactoylglutathione lyase family enzyme